MTIFTKVLDMFDSSPKIRGVIDDYRNPEEKQKDWLHEEIAYGTSDYGDKPFIDDFGTFFDQNSVGSCVPHSHTHIAGLLFPNFREDSKEFLYRLRSNYPQEGTYPQELANLYVKFGSPSYDMCPNHKTEKEASNLKLTEAMYVEAYGRRMSGYLSVKDMNNIDTINSIINSDKGVAICIYATFNEWAKKWIEPKDYVTRETAAVRHSIAVLPRSGFIYNGKKWLTIHDSAPFAGFKTRYISEDFIKERVYNALYYTNPQFNGTEKPKHIFPAQILKFGDTDNKEVAWLQKCLQYEKLFPTQDNNRPFNVTGNFYGMTLKAVKEFQKKYAIDILVPAGIPKDDPTGIVGKYTINKLNQLFS